MNNSTLSTDHNNNTLNLDSLSPTNRQHHQIPCAFPFVPSYIYTSLILGITIILLNGFVFCLFCKKRSLRTLPGNYILASLSVNDLLNGCYVLYKLYPYFYLRNNGCQRVNQLRLFEMEWPTISKTVYTTLLLSSVLHLVILSSDRLTYVVRALTYNSLVTRSKIIRFLVISWVLCTVFACVQLMWSLRGGPWNESRRQLRVYHTIVLGVLFIVLPSVILLVQSMTMILLVRRLGKSTSGGRKAFALYVCMYLAFMVCAYPYFIISLMFDVGVFRKRIPADVIRVCVIMRFVPCLINPCMYSLQNKDYRKVIKTYLRRLKKTTERYQQSRSGRRSGVDHLLISRVVRDDTRKVVTRPAKETVETLVCENV